jgi:Cu-Zn family superoxide dismutase
VLRVGFLALLLALALAAPAGAAPREYILPGTDTFPEGVATRPGTDQFFVTSTTDGTVFRGSLRRERTRVFLRPGTHGRVNAIGVKATRDRLIVAGGVTGTVFVYSLPRGRLMRSFSTGSGGLVNDVALTSDGDAYVTDSRRGLLFRIPARALERRAARTTALSPWVRLARSPTGTYTNGVVAAGRRHLLVVSTATGALVRIDRRTKRVRQVDLGGAELPGGDGLALAGRTLYVVNAASRVSELRMSRDWLRARLVRQITSPRLRFPTTVAVAGKRLLVVNSQFGARGGTPVLPFTVAALRRP